MLSVVCDSNSICNGRNTSLPLCLNELVPHFFLFDFLVLGFYLKSFFSRVALVVLAHASVFFL